MYSKKNRLRKMIPFSLCQTLFSSLTIRTATEETRCALRELAVQNLIVVITVRSC